MLNELRSLRSEVSSLRQSQSRQASGLRYLTDSPLLFDDSSDERQRQIREVLSKYVYNLSHVERDSDHLIWEIDEDDEAMRNLYNMVLSIYPELKGKLTIKRPGKKNDPLSSNSWRVSSSGPNEPSQSGGNKST